MKKLIVMLLVLIALLTPMGAALAEGGAVVPAVDVTKVLLGVMWLAFDALLAWLAKEIVPPARRWLDAHASARTQERVWNLIRWLVEAAEQTIVGPLRGPERLSQVEAELRRRGVEVDRALIEAAVKEMKDGVLEVIRESAGELPGEMVDDGK